MGKINPNDDIVGHSGELNFRIGATPFELVKIQPGNFNIGSPEAESGHQSDESPVRTVKISRPFYLGRCPITQRQFEIIMGPGPSSFRGMDLPQDQVTFPLALEFCRRLSAMAGIPIALPTEAQWEYAARAGTSTAFYSGDTAADFDRIGWCELNSGGTIHPVGLKQPNAFGLYDMLGNIWELTADFLGPYKDIADCDPAGTLNRRGAMRGGAWDRGLTDVRAARRLLSDPMFGGSGVRIAVNPRN